MKTVLICHGDSPLIRHGLSRWLASFSELAGIIVLNEKKQRKFKRFSRELKRVGTFRFIDVLAFRLYNRMFLANSYRVWEQAKLEELRRTYPEIPEKTPVLKTYSPNSDEAKRFIEELKPDIMLALCKTLLNETVFSVPSKGTFVMHPGICPEYRNAHGCFWALVNDDPENVGMTLLKIDKGVDTGPVYGYYSYDFDETSESHTIIQQRVVFENLERLREKFTEIYNGMAVAIDTSERKSAAWGQPWLSRYLRWKSKARKKE